MTKKEIKTCRQTRLDFKQKYQKGIAGTPHWNNERLVSVF